MTHRVPAQSDKTLSPWMFAFFAVAMGAYVPGYLAAGNRAVLYIVVHLVLSALCVVMVAKARDERVSDDSLQRVFYLGIFTHLALIFVRTYTSTDASRYLWDGAVVLSGHDPYALSANAPSLAAVRQQWPLPLDHHDTVSCYPPLTEAIWALCVALSFKLSSLGFFCWKLLLALAAMHSSSVLWKHSTTREQKSHALLYVLSPLILLEGAVGAHLDILCAATVIYALICAEKERWTWAGLALGTAVALKLTPAILCVALWPRAKPWWRWPFLCAIVPAITLGIPWALGAALPGSIPLVAQHWNFNSPLWHALYTRWPTSDHLIRPSLAALGLVLVVAQWFRRKAPIAALCRDALIGYALTNPTLYPWYLSTLVACTSRAPSYFAWGLITVAPLTYEVIDGYQRANQWHPAEWTYWTTAIAPVLCMFVGILVRKRERLRALALASSQRESEQRQL